MIWIDMVRLCSLDLSKSDHEVRDILKCSRCSRIPIFPVPLEVKDLAWADKAPRSLNQGQETGVGPQIQSGILFFQGSILRFD